MKLFIRCSGKRGCRVDSVPLIRLKELAGFKNRSWEFNEFGWLILEAHG